MAAENESVGGLLVEDTEVEVEVEDTEVEMMRVEMMKVVETSGG